MMDAIIVSVIVLLFLFGLGCINDIVFVSLFSPLSVMGLIFGIRALKKA